MADDLATSLQGHTDPEALAAEWVEAVRLNMSPAAIGLWIRD